MLTIGQILFTKKSEIKTVSMDTPVEDACDILAANRIGILVVTEPNGMVTGVLSERDIVKHVASRRNFYKLLVSDICTKKPVTCVRSDYVADVLKDMKARHFRHMPVVEYTHLLGVVSIGDLYHHLLEEFGRDALTEEWSQLDGYL